MRYYIGGAHSSQIVEDVDSLAQFPFCAFGFWRTHHSGFDKGEQMEKFVKELDTNGEMLFFELFQFKKSMASKWQ